MRVKCLDPKFRCWHCILWKWKIYHSKDVMNLKIIDFVASWRVSEWEWNETSPFYEFIRNQCHILVCFLCFILHKKKVYLNDYFWKMILRQILHQTLIMHGFLLIKSLSTMKEHPKPILHRSTRIATLKHYFRKLLRLYSTLIYAPNPAIVVCSINLPISKEWEDMIIHFIFHK